MDDLTDGLRECPFCGSGAKLMHMEYGEDGVVWGVWCLSDYKAKYPHGHYIDNFATEKEAIMAWNRRYDS